MFITLVNQPHALKSPGNLQFNLKHSSFPDYTVVSFAIIFHY